MKYILDKLSEASTWAAIFAALAGVVGFNVDPELQGLVAGAGISAVAVALWFVKERKA
jgi:stage V sporulation protein SpoVS